MYATFILIDGVEIIVKKMLQENHETQNTWLNKSLSLAGFINLLLTISHFSGFCKQVYLATARGKISRIDTKFIWLERALRV